VIPGLFEDLIHLDLFGYITFRMGMAGITAFIFAVWWGGITIRWLKSKRVIEDLSATDLQPRTDIAAHKGKADTPTMGGSFLVGSFLASTVLWARLDNIHVILGVVLVFALGAVGFVDDWRKLTIPNCKGISTGSKMLGLSIVTLTVLAAWLYYVHTTDRMSMLSLYFPVWKGGELPFAAWGIVGLALFVGFEYLLIVGTANAANITDGLDGLCAGCMLIAGLTLSVYCYVAGRFDWAAYLHLTHVPDASEMAILGGALCGACMGFLWYNAHPADVFMGDSGSLPIGGLLAWMAIVSKQELVLPLIAFVFYADLGSTALQTVYFKLSGGKRVFTCAPIHHGYERFGGIFKKSPNLWPENKIVVRGWIVAGVCAMAGLSLLKVR
jgi:phospho-N-acetylmuramoyl-pentapeptide-transferase